MSMDTKTSDSAMFSQAGEEDKFYGNTATSVENDTSNRNNSPLTPATDEDNLNAQKEQEWRDELAKLEDDIMTLRQVLHYKIQQTNELKHKLGITPMKEFQQDLKNGLQNIKESETLQKIQNSDAYQKTGEVFKSVGAKFGGVFSLTRNKLGDVRNSNAFRSFEERLGGAVSNVKPSRSIGSLRHSLSMTSPMFSNDLDGGPRSRVRSSKTEEDFETVLKETKDEEARKPSAPSS